MLHLGPGELGSLMMRYFVLIVGALLLLGIAPSVAQIPLSGSRPPSIQNVIARMVLPAEGMAAIAARGAARLPVTPLNLASGVTTAPVPVEIVELARALKNDPDLIYEYVYNNIETLPQFGSLKGPLGALLDGKGTAFDQAELMVALLQQAGIPASFQIGFIQLTTDQLT